MLTALLLLNVAELLVIIYLLHLSFKERDKLLNRIMAKNYEQYERMESKPETNDFSDGTDKFVELEDAKKDIMNG